MCQRGNCYNVWTDKYSAEMTSRLEISMHRNTNFCQGFNVEIVSDGAATKTPDTAKDALQVVFPQSKGSTKEIQGVH